jgi:hypothetical protein
MSADVGEVTAALPIASASGNDEWKKPDWVKDPRSCAAETAGVNICAACRLQVLTVLDLGVQRLSFVSSSYNRGAFQ